MPRIVSLIASSTEIVCALGFEPSLVGRSHECDYPASIKKLPVCTESKVGLHGTSYDIDQQVRALVQEALSVYRVDGDVLRELKPDLIVTQDQCEVCAVSLPDVEEALEDWLGARPIVISLAAEDLAGVWADIGRVAEALEAPERGEALIDALKSRMEDISERARDLPKRPSVACIEWIEPLMAAGNWMPELVEMAGGENLFGEAGRHSPWMTWEELREKDPEVVVVLPCGFNIERTRAEMGGLISLAGWSDLKAVQGGRVYLADGNQYFNRPGPRLAESLEILAELFHPGRFSFGHDGGGWERFSS
jgi:iron complex transport system substrate-binding protein